MALSLLLIVKVSSAVAGSVVAVAGSVVTIIGSGVTVAGSVVATIPAHRRVVSKTYGSEAAVPGIRNRSIRHPSDRR